ncbi:hypothetical protein F1880_008547 [Penicillium rolfsii]|nr:hypothetical protein F1880_008547 [Penicillium rolfsii]
MAPSPPRQKPPASNKPSPENHRVFDPWNSSSSGHQRAENPFSSTTSWRDTRSAKLKQQFRGNDWSRDSTGVLGDEDFSAKAFDGTCGSVSPVAENYGGGSQWRSGNASVSEGRMRAGEWRWVSQEEATREQLGVRDIRSFMNVGKRKAGDAFQVQVEAVKKARTASEKKVKTEELCSLSIPTMTASAMPAPKSSTSSTTRPTSTSTTEIPPNLTSKSKSEPTLQQPRQTTTHTSSLSLQNNPASSSKLFTGTTIYINGSTLPQISDHKLKAILASHGATIAIGMARKTVSHIIIGQPGTTGQGAGGGLAAGKLQKEIERGGWKGVRVVGVDWVLESIKAGKRLAVSRFAVLNIAQKGQRSVASIFGGK